MAFLSLSGIPIPLDAGSPLQYRRELLGEVSRSFAGQLRSGVRGRRWTLSGSTMPLLLEEALAMRDLVDGRGHSWSFDAGMASSTGIVPSLITGSAGGQLGGAKYGAGRMRCAPGGRVRWPLVQGTETLWRTTLAFWVRGPELGSGAWTHLVIDLATEEVYRDGVLWTTVDVLTDYSIVVAVTEAYLEMGCHADGVGEVSYDDLVVLPYRVPTSWLPTWATSNVPFGPLPFHRVAGTGVHEPVLMLGQAGDGTAMELWTEAGQFLAHEAFDFELREG
ncbi:hypothetical protein FJV41_20820 [Myxococcus llanfairpwllgwyngyllgogerychwyrndrobwllllantysiliogogogochensis]|uniref:Uncharacterized protein n=1 Tax=Myxococcus llanfairpwllgwyngyllgogerychwyrndrobwllllantysiliogogogochensis TaxID=2590453 RepID=A0A540WZY9_9BACT|nr:hypothetical protein [Myxococcus llanfairpwllgwyngyllgogerychwyrndrobwllllantysiliogogogochensis]TQF14044.1 hypothetical protein FJV41_20820 [Myxococcus llanfairpwllgwyngyllgogerychwyrndrobwllllantysiliogogogochensis]